MHFNAQTMIQRFTPKLILFFTFNEASWSSKKTEAKKPYESGLIAALNEVELSSVEDFLRHFQSIKYCNRFVFASYLF